MIDGYLELRKGNESLAGETIDRTFRGKAFEIISFELESQQDLSSPPLVSDPGEEGGQFFTFTVSKVVDIATPLLFKAFCERLRNKTVTWKTAVVTLRKASGGQPLPYLVFQFTDVYIKKWSLDGKDGESEAEEDIEFCFNTCDMRYQPQAAGGAAASLKTGHWEFNKSQTAKT